MAQYPTPGVLPPQRPVTATNNPPLDPSKYTQQTALPPNPAMANGPMARPAGPPLQRPPSSQPGFVHTNLPPAMPPGSGRPPTLAPGPFTVAPQQHAPRPPVQLPNQPGSHIPPSHMQTPRPAAAPMQPQVARPMPLNQPPLSGRPQPMPRPSMPPGAPPVSQPPQQQQQQQQPPMTHQHAASIPQQQRPPQQFPPRPPAPQPSQLPVQAPDASTTISPTSGASRRRLYPEESKLAYSQTHAPAPRVPSNEFVSPNPQQQQQQQQHHSSGVAHQPFPATNGFLQQQQQQQPFQSPPVGPFVPSMPQHAHAAPGPAPVDLVQQQMSAMNITPPDKTSVPQYSPVNLMSSPMDVNLARSVYPIKFPQGIMSRLKDNQLLSPEFARCTINAIPQSSKLLQTSKIPLGLIVTPFHTLQHHDPDIPIVTTGIARCRRCRAYINPFVVFSDDTHWRCNFCSLPNEVPDTFYLNLDNEPPSPMKRDEKPELSSPIVEFQAMQEYMVRAPAPLVHVFLIDVSQFAVRSGVLKLVSSLLAQSLDDIPNIVGEERSRVCVITFDSALHFYDLNPAFSQPQVRVITDIDDVFVPQPEDLLVDLHASKDALLRLLERLPMIYGHSSNGSSALGAALQAAFRVINPVGGKIVLFQATLPNTGTGTLKPRDDSKLYGTGKESALFRDADPFYKTMATDCSRHQVTVDVFLFNTTLQPYIDVATLGCLAKYTGGDMYYYAHFDANKSECVSKLGNEMCRLLSNQVGLEAVLRIRASVNLKLQSYMGNHFTRSTDLLALPTVNYDMSYAAEIVIEETLKQNFVFFQTALLYTTCFGERRIRVMTQVMPVVSTLAELYHAVDVVALTAYLAKQSVDRVLSDGLEKARDALCQKTCEWMSVYGKQVLNTNASTPPMSLPENMRCLPLLMLALMKSPALRAHSPSAPLSSDQRSHALALLTCMPPEWLVDMILPRLYALHRMTLLKSPQEEFLEPALVNLSVDQLEKQGLYLMCDGMHLFLFAMKMIPQEWCRMLFAVQSYQEIPSGKYTLPDVAPNAITDSVSKLVRGLQDTYAYYPIVTVIKEDERSLMKNEWLLRLVENQTDAMMSYAQFMNVCRSKVAN